jgi:hypothetical protein
MIDPIADIARAAAHRLAAEYGPTISAEVNLALHAPESIQRTERYLDPTSLGALIVSIANLAWTVYVDLQKKTPKPSPAVVARTIRIKLENSHEFNSTQQANVIDIVVDQTVRAAKDDC